MKDARWVFSLMLLVSMAAVSGCTPQNEGFSVEELQKTAEYSILETAIAIPTETVPPLPTERLTNTSDPNSTATSTSTLKPTLTATITLPPPVTPTPIAQVKLTGDLNCRTGPSNHYDLKTVIQAGQTVNVVGESSDGYYWVIENPDEPGTCWIWKAFTTLVAPIGRIPVFFSPPTKTPTRTSTPTPVPAARFQFSQVTSCGGQDVLVILVFNSSRRILQSWRARLFNIPGKTLQVDIEEAQFAHNMHSCQLSVNNLEFRQTGYMVIPIDVNSATSFFVEVEACNYTGGIRDCAFDAISFNNLYITATPTYTPTPTDTPTPTSTITPTITP